MRYINIHVMFGGNDFSKEENFFSRKVEGAEIVNVFVQNKAEGLFPAVAGGIEISGSNELREFSGWREGIESLLNKGLLEDDDILVLTNDSIFREKRLLPIVNEGWEQLQKMDLSGRQVFGPIVYHLFDIKVFDVYLNKLLATYFLAIRWGALKKIGGVCGVVDFDQYLSLSFDDGALFRVPKAGRYNKFYNDWLGSGRVSGRGDWWASQKIPFVQENYNFLKQKAKMILLESNLTARLVKHNFEMLDLYKTSRFSIMKKRTRRFLSLIFRGKNSGNQ